MQLPGTEVWQATHGWLKHVAVLAATPEDVCEPTLMPLFIEGAPAKAIGRYASIGGEWHLWVYCCEWSLMLEDVQLAHSESDNVTMNRVLYLLIGQVLKAIDIDPADGRTRFTFGLGCSLLTYPAPSGIYGNEPVGQWKLLTRSGPCLAVREDGSYWIGDRHEKPVDMQWLLWGARTASMADGLRFPKSAGDLHAARPHARSRAKVATVGDVRPLGRWSQSP